MRIKLSSCLGLIGLVERLWSVLSDPRTTPSLRRARIMVTMRVFALLAIALVFAGAVQALEKDQVLVLVGNNAIQHTHSKYFSILQGMSNTVY